MIYDGLSEGVCRKIVFLDVKAPQAGLNANQRLVRECIEAGRVEWAVLKLPTIPELSELSEGSPRCRTTSVHRRASSIARARPQPDPDVLQAGATAVRAPSGVNETQVRELRNVNPVGAEYVCASDRR